MILDIYFDIWVKLFLETWFLPYKVLGNNAIQDNICK